jgi:hypothetical protein
VAKVGADERLFLLPDIPIQPELIADLVEPLQIDLPRLPMPLTKVFVHQRQLRLAGPHVHLQHGVSDAPHARPFW